jgi:hypothetical protein
MTPFDFDWPALLEKVMLFFRIAFQIYGPDGVSLGFAWYLIIAAMISGGIYAAIRKINNS